MADIAKVITIIGSSPESFAKAADAAVQEASKTLRGISGADVVSMSAVVENDRISEYRTTVNIAFAVERWSGWPRAARARRPGGERLRLSLDQRSREVPRVERAQVVEALADADQ